MEIWMIAGVLLVISGVLFSYSFIKKEEKDAAYKELESFSLAVTKTVYDLNERIHMLESKMSMTVEEEEKSTLMTRLMKDNTITLFTKGVATKEIARQLDLSQSSVQEVINDYITEGIQS
ncbi:helix-turn-helix domain-containing protein [Alkalibacterium olivapovliticus]|uniref:Uncharacterized protein n=1 Tax=Alkalibacterium olivapovliticus TaxID=99907 RepID=A0A2T0W979_9LACT|nr:helix-turn-helix domain-containing protein [Alkalibacterium olivapovliticus]PRY83268.1 hypothetical protein CLV38_10548 [Alkalibacterium olivapovliticus]